MRRGLSRHNNRSAGGVTTAFTPLSLFADGSQGVWYDDSLTSSMFQDAAGTTAAALESPVGLQLDLSQGLVVGSELVVNGDFSGGTTTGWTAQGGATLSVDSGRMKVVTTGGAQGASQALTGLVVGTIYQISVTVTVGGADWNVLLGNSWTQGQGFSSGQRSTSQTYSIIYICTSAAAFVFSLYSYSAGTTYYDNITVKSIAGNHRFQTTNANRPTLSARYNLLTATATLATQSITTVATSYTIYFTGSGTVTLSGTYIGVFSAGTNTFTATAGTLTVTVVGSVLTADIRPTNQTTTLPAYQYVTSSSVYDTVGFPQYIKYTTGNASLSTASINFTATAQMSVFSGVRKLNSSTGIINELSASSNSNNGAFTVYTTANIQFINTGTALVVLSGAAVTNPSSVVVTAIGNIPSSITQLRYNGVQVDSSVASLGTGNYGNYPMYFGARGGSGLPFNGYEFQTIIVGKTLTATEIANTETYVNSKTKAY